MEFLVQINISFPSDMTECTQSELYDAETARSKILATEGFLVRLWRLPGRRSNWGLWQANDATELHEALASLPLWRYMEVEVVPLARHPNDPLTPTR